MARFQRHGGRYAEAFRYGGAVAGERREVFRVAGLLGLGSLLPSPRVEASTTAPALPATPGAVEIGPKIYESLGVRPFINCRGTITVIGGSMEQPEVRAAKTLANQQYVQMDELMAAAGKRLAELTGAEWGMVSAGCAAAISHATAACIAGGNPDLHIRIPDLRGFPKDEVIIPTESRNSYDAAITAVGAKLIEVDSMDALKLAIGPKTAMIYVEGGSGTDSGPMSVEAISAVAKQHNVPVLVDAAPEILTVLPNVHLQRGATLVAYSGGKVIRGPQSAGLLLGRKDLVQAAWVHSAPHHGYARSMKIGREEIVGMVVAVENYVKRDHDAEWKEWVGRCDHIANRLTKIPGVVANVRREPGGRGNRSPRVSIAWDSKKLNITGAEVTEILDTTEPRIVLGGGGGGRPGQAAGSGNRHQHLDVSLHDGRRGRKDRRQSPLRDPVSQARTEGDAGGEAASRQSHRHLEGRHPVRREQEHPHHQHRPGRQPAAGHTSGGIPRARARRLNRRRSGTVRHAAGQQRGRRYRVPIQRQAEWRFHVRRARHGRVSGCHVDGAAPHIRRCASDARDGRVRKEEGGRRKEAILLPSSFFLLPFFRSYRARIPSARIPTPRGSTLQSRSGC